MMGCLHNYELVDVAADFQALVCTKCSDRTYIVKEMISMSEKETSESVATIAGRILSAGNPLDNEQVVLAIHEAISRVRPTDQGSEARAIAPILKPYFDNMLSLAGSALSQVEHDKIVVPVDVNWDFVANAIVGAIEGGSDYWMGSFDCPKDDERSQELRRFHKLNDRIWYSEADYWKDGGKGKVTYDNPEKGDDIISKTFDKHDILLGLRRMAEKSSAHFSDLINENDDAETHDVFIQYVLLGDIVYG